MSYLNNEKKFVIVVNRQHAIPTILNALAHAVQGMSGKKGGPGNLLDYRNTATGFEAKIDEYPFIVLEAKNSLQVQTAVTRAMNDANLSYNVFTTSMLASSAEAQLQATLDAVDENLDFVLAVLFGAREDVDPITKKFSLFKG